MRATMSPQAAAANVVDMHTTPWVMDTDTAMGTVGVMEAHITEDMYVRRSLNFSMVISLTFYVSPSTA